MKADVIVVNWRTPDDLRRFSTSLIGETGIGSISIMNNEPTERDHDTAMQCMETLHSLLDVPVIYTSFPTNVGYSAAVNAAAAALNGPLLAIFNSDVEVTDGSMATMCDFMDQHPSVGVAGPKQVDGMKRITHGGVFGTNQRPQHRSWHHRDEYGACTDVRTDCVTVSGSAYFVRRTCWDELTNCPTYQESCRQLTGKEAPGAFLPTQHYYEETFCSVHARDHGWKVAFNGKAKMIHHWQGASKDGVVLTKYMKESLKMYRIACNDHGISHE